MNFFEPKQLFRGLNGEVTHSFQFTSLANALTERLGKMEDDRTYVRDLIWAINSPPLMQFTKQASVATHSLSVGEINSDHLKAWLGQPIQRRVGRYFERLVQYWICHIRKCEIVSHSHQIIEEQRTVGEIDLLFRDERGRLTHWEIAVKFYLQLERGHPATLDYIGPNANDTLTKKRDRLVEHQLPLSSRYFPEVEVRQAFVKGRIFYHWQSAGQTRNSSELTIDHLVGRWLRLSELTEFLAAKRRRFRLLRKPFWLSEQVTTPLDRDLLDATEFASIVESHFAKRGSPLLVASFEADRTTTTELERYFVVPDHWPGRTATGPIGDDT